MAVEAGAVAVVAVTAALLAHARILRVKPCEVLWDAT